MKCLYHTEGENCHLCREGYYGSALQQDCRSEWETWLQPLHQPCRGQQQTPERFLPGSIWGGGKTLLLPAGVACSCPAAGRGSWLGGGPLHLRGRTETFAEKRRILQEGGF